jgi:hypothetical protein
MCKQLKGQLDCPVCYNTLDGATSPENPESSPSPGDFSICLYCQTILQYEADGDDGLKFKKVSMEELQLLHIEDPDTFNGLAQAQDMARQIQANQAN